MLLARTISFSTMIYVQGKDTKPSKQNKTYSDALLYVLYLYNVLVHVKCEFTSPLY